MALFQPDPKYYTEDDKFILDKMNNFYADAITINQSFWLEADTDTRFEAGDQTLWNELYGSLPLTQRKQFNFNRIRRVTNMISGHQRRNRKSTIVTPIESGDEFTADQFTKLMYWINEQEGILNTVSESFHGALVTGMNLLQVWMDYRSDPISGNIKVDRCGYNSFLMDPYFRKPDLSDCNSIWKRSYLTKRECLSLLPGREEELGGLRGNDSRDGKFEFLPESHNCGPKNLLTYDEFYYRDYRTQRMLVDTQTGESLEWKSEDKDALEEFLRVYPQITVIDQEIPTVRVAIVVQNRVMYDGPNPIGIDQYPFVPVLGYFNPEIPHFDKRIQGVVRGLRDAQYLYNRRKIIELDILESQINSGFKYKENALVNPKDVFLNGQGRGLALKEDAQMTDVEQILPPQLPPSMIQLSEILAKEVQEISGVNEELLGSAMDDKAGILSMLRQGAGLTTLQGLFDQLDYSQKLLGKIILDLVQTNFTPGKVKRIIEQEPSPQFYHKAFGKYDAAIEEGLNTTTQKQMQFAQLLQLRESGIPIPDDVLIEAATIQNKKELTESIDQQKQQEAQMQQMQLQAALKEQEARTNLADARAVADQGLGLERLSRIKENQALAVERRAEAVKDRTAGLLNLVKALQEIEGADISQLEQMIRLASDVQQRQEQADKVNTELEEGIAGKVGKLESDFVKNVV
jgi:hypothetical protein